MPGIPAICWGLAKLVMIPISSDALNIAKAREILSKHEM